LTLFKWSEFPKKFIVTCHQPEVKIFEKNFGSDQIDGPAEKLDRIGALEKIRSDRFHRSNQPYQSVPILPTPYSYINHFQKKNFSSKIFS
jgi:hypothetical protein